MPPVDYPDFDFRPQRFADREAAFIRMVQAAGGKAIVADGRPLAEIVRQCYPEARTIASILPEVQATLDPDAVNDARELCNVDLGVVSGRFGVAENGAVWIRQDIRYKALYFAATDLVIVIPRTELVDTMHEAMIRPEMQEDFDFGCFMSGPSKTADIEQALVFGAHGPMSVTVVLQ